MKTVMKYIMCLVVAVCFIGTTIESAEAQQQAANRANNTGIGKGINTSSFFDDTDGLVQNTYKQGSGVVYGVGGLGAIALGALAMFGRFQWQWLMALIGGLLTIAGVGTGIQYLTGANVGLTN